jgi:hypothetical protein
MVRWIIFVVTVVASVPVQSAEKPASPSPTQSQARAPQPPPLPSSPIEHFRQLLGMKGEEREKALAARSPKTREFLEAKLKAYEALPPEERENRLGTLELRWYLLPLFKTAPTNRETRLAMIPGRIRPLIDARLRLWDLLSADEQRDVLESEPAITVLVQPEPGMTSPAGALSVITPQQQEKIKKSTEILNRLPPEKQEDVYRNFGRFFELSQQEKTKAFDVLGEAERKQMERTLALFDTLPKASRDRCIEGFQKFTSLSEIERDQFLRNVERWNSMSAKDRQAWRSLVNRKALPHPPLPPGASNPAAALPTPTGFLVLSNN